jgi:polyphosphate kinase
MSELIAKLSARLLSSLEVSEASDPEPVEVGSKPLAVAMRGNARFFNREISDLLFIERVMEEARNKRNPALERLRFLAIAADVLDQFFAVRVSGLRRSVARKEGYLTQDGLTAVEQLLVVQQKSDEILRAQQEDWLAIQEDLLEHDISILEPDQLNTSELVWLRGYFRSNFLHVLTPFTIDEEHPFPFIPSGGLCVILELSDGYVLLPLPRNLSRFIRIPGPQRRFVSAETLIYQFWGEIFPDEECRACGIFQILRDNDLAKEERNNDLRATVESGLRLRHQANVIKLKVSASMPVAGIRFVADHLRVNSTDEILAFDNHSSSIAASRNVFSARLVGLSYLGQVIDNLAEELPEHIFPPYKARYPSLLEEFNNDCFAAIRDRDLMVHWPYESFASVMRFLEQAASDPAVVALKQTLYRTNDESPIVESLIMAAKNGKTVLAVIELEARDNEESNIQLARKMESAGVQIVYGIVGLKIHCKATLVVRMENDAAITYTHLGTGNYHPSNARMYTDISFFTRDQDIGFDAHLAFSYLTSERIRPPTKLLMAPYFLRQKLYDLIDREIAHARAGRAAHICIKVNSLTDEGMIERFYTASEAGVEIDLVIRRHCVLRPGVEGLSSRIRVKSIVGRFLEHSRIYMFANGEALTAEGADVFFGSADLMARNLDERVELVVPVENLEIKRQLVDGIMHANIKDTAQSWLLNGDNQYHRVNSTENFCAQSHFMEQEYPATLGPFEDWGQGTR